MNRAIDDITPEERIRALHHSLDIERKSREKDIERLEAKIKQIDKQLRTIAHSLFGQDQIDSLTISIKADRARRARERAVAQLQRQIIEELKAEAPPCPRPPQWDEIFVWYYQYGKPRGMTIKSLTTLTDRAASTIYHRHMEYRAEHDDTLSQSGNK